MPKDIKQYTPYNKLIYAIYIHRRALELVLKLYRFFRNLSCLDETKLLSQYFINNNLYLHERKKNQFILN